MMLEWYDQIQRDMRLAGRRAVRHATFTVVVIVCVALGIGATVSALSVLHPVLLRPLAFEKPEQLVQISSYNVTRTNPDERYWIAWFPIETLEREARTLGSLAAFYQKDFDVLDGTEPERIAGAETKAGSFEVLGVRPIVGRTLSEEDVRSGRRVVLISEPLWTRRYGRDPDAVGRTITLGALPHEIVGVLPGEIRLDSRAEIFALYHPSDYTRREHLGLGAFVTIARVPEGVDAATVQRDLDAMLRGIQEAEPIFYQDFGFDARDLRDYLVGDFRRPLWALLASALFVFLLASANVANLLMARSQGEVWERGLRAALGARCSRIAQQGIVENTFLVGIGAILGLALGGLGVRMLLARVQLSNPAFEQVGLSVPVVIGAVLFAALLASALSILPAVRCYAAITALNGTRDGRGSRSERRLQATFVAAQVALSFVLLVGAGLMLKSTNNLARLDLGIDTEHLLTLRVAAPPSAAVTSEGRVAFTDDVISRLQALPDVEAVGAAAWLPVADPDVGFTYSVEDYPPESGAERLLHPGRIVAPGYFAALGIPVLSGRDFAASDDGDAPRVAIVSRAFERRYWPDGSALGKRVKRGTYEMPDRPWLEIVGVVGDVRSGSISAPIQPAIFYPQAQSEGAFLAQMGYAVRARTQSDQLMPAVRAAVGEISSSATIFDVATGHEIRDAALGRARFNSLLIGVFAAIGLVLAAAGVFGVTSYGVGRRTREFGLRSALGAGPAQVRGMVLKGAGLLAAAGIVVGALGASALSRSVSELLYEVRPGDPTTYLSVAGILAASVLVATYLPARRATKVDPTVALNDDCRC